MNWIAFLDRSPPLCENGRGATDYARVLVTNNLEARDAFGSMSHLWIGRPREVDDSGNGVGKKQWSVGEGGEYLTHWCDPASIRFAADESAKPFQARVQPWMMECFGPEIADDRIERNHRFFEESTETVQANGMTRSEAHQLVDYTYDRPVGELHQEIGGVMVTLAALCLASGQDMHAAGETELARIWTKVERIRAKQAAKPKHSPLPEHVEAAPVASKEAKPDEAICEHDWRPITEPHKCCEKCGDVRRDWNATIASKETVTLSDEEIVKYWLETPRGMALSKYHGVLVFARAILAQRDASKAEGQSS